jgi:hypothetical protein
VFRSGRRQIETQFDSGFEFLRVKGKAQNTIDPGIRERKFAFGRNRERDNGHFARGSHFADLVDSFDNALRARLEAGRWMKAVRRHDHEIEIFATGFVSKLVYASRPRGFDGGAVVTDIQNHDFNQVANAAIGIANQ